MQEILLALRDKGVTPRDSEEKMFFLQSLGITLVKTFTELDNHFKMLFVDNIILYPWKIKVRFADFNFKVAKVDFYFEPLETTVMYWICLESMADAGLQPLLRLDKVGQDMVWMCDNQAQELINSAACVPVKDEFGIEYYPETTYHVKYFFDVLYGVRGYEDGNGNTRFVSTDHIIANQWRDVIVRNGCYKIQKVLSNDRYFKFLDSIDRMTVGQENKAVHVIEDKVVNNSQLVNVLTSRL